MARSPHSYVTAAVFLMSHVLSQVEAQQCKSEYSIYGAMLKGHVFEQRKTANFLSCVQRCNSNVRCQSVNYVISQYECELNSRTKEAKPEDFVPDADRTYVTRLSGRGIIVFQYNVISQYEIHELHDKHHKVSPTLDSHKTQIILKMMYYSVSDLGKQGKMETCETESTAGCNCGMIKPVFAFFSSSRFHS